MTAATIAIQQNVSPWLPAVAESAAVLRSDRVRFESTYHQYSGRIYAHVYHMTGNAEDAQDVSQECFIRA